MSGWHRDRQYYRCRNCGHEVVSYGYPNEDPHCHKCGNSFYKEKKQNDRQKVDSGDKQDNQDTA